MGEKGKENQQQQMRHRHSITKSVTMLKLLSNLLCANFKERL